MLTRPLHTPVMRSSFWALGRDMLAVLGSDASIHAVNPACAAALGRAAETFAEQSLLSLVHPGDRGALIAAGRELSYPGVVVRDLELRLRHDDGTHRAFVWSASSDGISVEAVGRSAATAGDAVFGQAVLDGLCDRIAVLDEQGTIIATNLAWGAFGGDTGAGPAAAVGSDYLAACRPAAAADGLRALLRREQDELTFDYPCHGPDGERWFKLTASRCEHDGLARLVVSHEDITVRLRAEGKAQLRSRLLDAVPAAVIGTDAEYLITEWNRGAEELYGWTRQEALGRPVRELVVPEEAARPCDEAIASLDRGSEWAGDITLQRRDGTLFPAHVRDATIRDDDGVASGFIGVSIDLTERRHEEQRLTSAHQYLAAVTDSMAEGVLTHDEDGRLVYMNAAAEAMLGWTLEELEGVEMHATIQRRYPDGSPLPVEDCPIQRAGRAATVARGDDEVFIRADGTSFPIEYTASPFETPEGVSGAVVVFSDITQRQAERDRLAGELESLTWVARIHEAFAADRFRLHAQPIVDVRTGQVVQHELLIRMLDEEGETIPPGRFLPAAECHGVIAEIDRWVVQEGAALAARGHRIELNLSAESIVDPGMADFVTMALSSAGADPANVIVELTETAILRDEAAGRVFLERMAALGCKIALDDFGTGYGGFMYLKRLPVDLLKIDVEFVQDLAREESSRHVVRAVVQLAAGLGKKTVAEGVEDEESLTLLRAYGVDFAQGYGIGRPAPVAEVFGA